MTDTIVDLKCMCIAYSITGTCSYSVVEVQLRVISLSIRVRRCVMYYSDSQSSPQGDLNTVIPVSNNLYRELAP